MEMEEKVCGKCRRKKPYSSYRLDSRYKDGMDNYCIECRDKIKEKKKEKKRGVTAKRIKDTQKLHALLPALVESNGNMSEAYHSLGTTKNKASAANCAYSFLKTVDQDAVDIALNSEETTEMMASFMKEYLIEARVGGSLSEKRDALAFYSKLTNRVVDKSEVKNTGTPQQSVEDKLEDLKKRLEKSKEENE